MPIDVLTGLRQLGFSQYESKAYVALLQRYPANGYEVSRTARIPAAKIYETLSRLKAKGAVISSATDPVKYTPVPPETLLKTHRERMAATIDGLEAELKQLRPLPEVEFTSNLRGRQSVLDKIASVIDGAHESLIISLWPEEASVLKDNILRAEARHVRVVIALFGPNEFGFAHAFHLEGCRVSSQRRLGERLSVVVADSREVVISEVADSSDTAGVWTTTPSIVLVAKEYIKHDIWCRLHEEGIGCQIHSRPMSDESDVLAWLATQR